jgi:hypothetical protein
VASRLHESLKAPSFAFSGSGQHSSRDSLWEPRPGGTVEADELGKRVKNLSNEALVEAPSRRPRHRLRLDPASVTASLAKCFGLSVASIDSILSAPASLAQAPHKAFGRLGLCSPRQPRRMCDEPDQGGTDLGSKPPAPLGCSLFRTYVLAHSTRIGKALLRLEVLLVLADRPWCFGGLTR